MENNTRWVHIHQEGMVIYYSLVSADKQITITGIPVRSDGTLALTDGPAPENMHRQTA